VYQQPSGTASYLFASGPRFAIHLTTATHDDPARNGTACFQEGWVVQAEWTHFVE